MLNMILNIDYIIKYLGPLRLKIEFFRVAVKEVNFIAQKNAPPTSPRKYYGLKLIGVITLVIRINFNHQK